MTKLYAKLMTALTLILLALPANAEVQQINDLYGRYKMTMTIGDEGETTELEFSINESDNKNYKRGMLVGFMGNKDNVYINKFNATEHTITIYTPTINGYYLANEKGDFPIALTGDDTTFDLVISFDPETKKMTLPNMTVVELDYTNKSAKILTKYSNITATYIGELEKEQVDWAGTWTVSGGQDPYKISSYSYPESFDFTIEEEAGNYYLVDFIGVTLPNGGVKLDVDGNRARLASPQLIQTLPNGKVQRFADAWGATTIELKMEADHSITGKGFVLTENDEFAYFYGSSAYAQKKAGLDYAGTYDINVTLAYDMSEGKAPTTGQIVIENNNGQYIVKKFFDATPFSMNYDLMVLTPDASDPKAATINCTMLKYIETTAEGNYSYWGFADANLTNSPIKVTFDEEGSLHIAEFCLAGYVYDSSFTPVGSLSLVAWYQNLVGKKDATGIHCINAPTSEAGIEYYNLSGMKTNANQKGIVLMKKGGKVVKVLK